MTALDEEPLLSGALMVRGQHTTATAANVRLAQPAGTATYTFAAPFLAVYRGQHLSYRKGQTVHLDSATQTAWAALGANLTLVS